MKTIKQIADTLGIDKQKVYRYIKKHHINEAHQIASTMYYDEAVETQVYRHFFNITASLEAHQSTSEVLQSASSEAVTLELISMLKNELSEKNKLIDEQQQTIKELNETIKIQAQSINAAHHNELAETVLQALPDNSLADRNEDKNKKGFWRRFWKK